MQIQSHLGPFNNHADKMRGRGVKKYPHSGYKNCPRRAGGWVKKWQNSVYIVVESPFLNSLYKPSEIIFHPTAAGDDYQVLFFMETIPFANSDVGPKVLYPKYYNKYAYALAHEISSVCFSLF